MPRQRHVRGTWLHQWLGDGLFAPGLWRPSGSSVAAGVATGLFWAMIPMPLQMVPAGLTAYFSRCNVPAAITVVWISNPVTWPLMIYWQYRLGVWVLGEQAQPVSSVDAMAGALLDLTLPLLVGCLICGIIVAPVSYVVVALLWRNVAKRWWRRHRPMPGDLSSKKR
ncbi:MAG: DUF2062 domain-containing protein [Chthoniobacterales bacterium]